MARICKVDRHGEAAPEPVQWSRSPSRLEVRPLTGACLGRSSAQCRGAPSRLENHEGSAGRCALPRHYWLPAAASWLQWRRATTRHGEDADAEDGRGSRCPCHR